jgi:hypothetical protein
MQEKFSVLMSLYIKEKTEYCKKNNIRLIRISYKDYDKINEEYLMKLLEEADGLE